MCFCAPLGPHLAVLQTPRVCGCFFVVCSLRSCLTDTSPQHQELHEDVESWIEPGAQSYTRDACFSHTSHSH